MEKGMNRWTSLTTTLNLVLLLIVLVGVWYLGEQVAQVRQIASLRQNVAVRQIASPAPQVQPTLKPDEAARAVAALEDIARSLKTLKDLGGKTPIRIRLDQCVSIITNDIPSAISDDYRETERR